MQHDIHGEFFAVARTATEAQMAEAIPILRGLSESTTPPTGPLLLTMGKAAALAGVSRSTLWRMIRLKRLTPIEIMPGTFRVSRLEIEQLAAVPTRTISRPKPNKTQKEN